MSMLARVPRSRTTKDVDLAAQQAGDLAEAERLLSALVAADLGDHLTFRLIRSEPTGLGDNQPGVATRRFVYVCLDIHTDRQIDTMTVDLVVLAHTQSVDLHELRRAIAAKQALGGIEPFEHFEIPADWSRTYPTTAKGVPIAASFTATTAADIVAAFIDPVLGASAGDTAIWDPQELAWCAARARTR
ncbi:hypothetical protein [Nocardia sp. NPDC051750]|uniref:hypothetical protein n=1 Tax=Nocardia sp. NPDC051750 TaxID=3364325 RepID=UPI00378BDE15